MSDKILLQRLLKDFEILKKEKEQMRKKRNVLEKENLELHKKIKELKEKLSKYENPKNSTNSSVPPSQDPNRITKSLRKKSNKKPGGQKGHKLKMSEFPDEIIFHDITNCTCCGEKLTDSGISKSRQIFDLPEIKIKVTEHRIVKKTCHNCGEKNQSVFPEGLVQQAQLLFKNCK